MSDVLVTAENFVILKESSQETLVIEREVPTLIQIATAGPQGPRGVQGPNGDLNYMHTQSIPSTTWEITHNLGKFPSVVVVDSSGAEVEGEVTYSSVNQLTVVFSAGFSGYAYLN